ncbi:MAG: hypothetical protein CO022_06900 [Flavobacteriales bacterium CG_4_9_14_0_2_um_filter_32_27]|nr:MAG: hypothetical protein CO022_06900 [Flavobacteriales bacterium CG_4_9_14_0_2_um_filter_32_27]
MVRICFLCLFLLSVYSCKQKTQIPSNLLDEDKMVEIITQIEITQAYFKIKSIAEDSLLFTNNYQEQIFDTIFSQYNISYDVFNSSLMHYSSEPNKMEEIYSKVLVSLSEQQASFQ